MDDVGRLLEHLGFFHKLRGQLKSRNPEKWLRLTWETRGIAVKESFVSVRLGAFPYNFLETSSCVTVRYASLRGVID